MSMAAVETKERPILFSAPMVKAILEGRKTQTRRVIKNPEKYSRIRECAFLCPYGETGNHLWVRETWKTYREHSEDESAIIKASLVRFERGEVKDVMAEVKAWPVTANGEQRVLYAADFGEWAYDVDSDLKPWRPSIFMPRWVSRITLEITEVRVQRLQDITAEDCIAEGFDCHTESGIGWRMGFAKGWDKINDKRGYPWDSNPFVWCITFRRIQPAGAGRGDTNDTPRARNQP